MRKHYWIIVVVLAIFWMQACKNETAPPDLPTNLTVEYQTDPIGIGVSQPRLGWVVNDSKKGALQTGWQVLVASDENLLQADSGDVWNSGMVESDLAQQVPFQGKKLESGKKYFWKVRTRDQFDNISAWSRTAAFETALLDQQEWKAAWIGNGETGKPPVSIALRKTFELEDKQIASARVYVTGLGNYLLYLNGQKVGNDRLTPGWTDYNQKVQYQVYDVAEMLNKGGNAAGALLGNMWWSSGLGWKGGSTYSNGPLKFMMQLEVVYNDGTKTTIVTDETWKTNRSAIVSNHIYHGEKYDARLEEKGWNTTNFSDSVWTSAIQIETPALKLVPQSSPPIQVTQELVPEKITQPKEGVVVFDLGQNMVGGIRLIAKGEPGHAITIKYAELLHDDGTVAQENLRSARATDEYIMKGEGYEVYEPLFTYHGFRYVQVEGYPNEPEKNSVTGLVFHNAIPIAGKFATSNDMINKIQRNILWGLRGNFHSVPTDCPQRDERLGWMGDAQVIAPTACYNFNMAGFFTKWQQDILDGQDSAGWVYDVNPPIVVDGPASPGWGDAVVVVPWVLYNFYGDEQILENSYSGMKAWVDYMERNSNNYLYHYRRGDHEGYADWISVEKSPQKPVSAAYFFYSSKLLSKIAAVLGKTEDAAKYQQLSENIATVFNETYFNPETNNYEGATQTANLIPVAFGITPEEKRAAVMKNVADNVIAKGVHPTTGFLGTPLLLPMLTQYGYGELAYQMVNQTSYPSWGYMIEKGATTMWELWNSDTEPPDRMNSRNHFALGVIGEWFYGYLAGIRPVEEAPGFKKFVVEPSPLGDLKMAQANYVSPYGNILSKWEKEGDEFKLTLSVPANTTAQVRLPKIGLENPQVLNQQTLIFADGKPKSNKHLNFAGEIDGRIYFEAEPGNYELIVKQ